MKLVLSSRWTPLFKFAFPVAWSGLFGYGTGLLFLNPSGVRWHGGGEPPSWAKWVFLAGLFLGGFLCARIAKLKRVVLDEDSVVISNYLRRVRVPFKKIQAGGIEPDTAVEVYGGVGPIGVRDRRPLVALEFSGRTPFGRSIEFIPRSQEVLAELRKRLGWKEPPIEPPPEERSELADELRGRGTV